MKKEFEIPELSIYYLNVADVITTSTGMPGEGGDTEGDIEELL